MSYSWANCTMSDVNENGRGYPYTLIFDYERYVKDFGFIPVNDFIKGWTCITRDSFGSLGLTDIVYDCNGNKYVVMDEPYESDDEEYLYVEVRKVDEDGEVQSSGETLCTGDLYSENAIHQDYHWKKIKQKGEEKLCPILITKTNQLQN